MNTVDIIMYLLSVFGIGCIVANLLVHVLFPLLSECNARRLRKAAMERWELLTNKPFPKIYFYFRIDRIIEWEYEERARDAEMRRMEARAQEVRARGSHLLQQMQTYTVQNTSSAPNHITFASYAPLCAPDVWPYQLLPKTKSTMRLMAGLLAYKELIDADEPCINTSMNLLLSGIKGFIKPQDEARLKIFFRNLIGQPEADWRTIAREIDYCTRQGL